MRIQFNKIGLFLSFLLIIVTVQLVKPALASAEFNFSDWWRQLFSDSESNSISSQPQVLGVESTWEYLSAVGPNTGNQQTASLIIDVDKDGVNDFVVTERTAAPSV